MPRFVLLEHDHPSRHWDFMLEWGASLRTWRLDRIPSEAARIPAEPLPDHRLAYLDYEGPVSGERGTVQRVAGGTFKIVSAASDCLEVQLASDRLRGTARLHLDSGALDWEPATDRGPT